MKFKFDFDRFLRDWLIPGVIIAVVVLLAIWLCN